MPPLSTARALAWWVAALAAFRPCPAGAADPAQVRQAIQHVIVIMQENRSFDNYFGTFPGADGIPVDGRGNPTTCYPLVLGQPQCIYPFHDRHNVNAGGSHAWQASLIDIDGNRMDGFAAEQAQEGQQCTGMKGQPGICPKIEAGLARHDAVSFHTADELPNYWTYAQTFALQDHLFESAEDYSLTAHLYMVSAWSAHCATLTDPETCNTKIGLTLANVQHVQLGWSSIADLLDAAKVSWKYYIDAGSTPDCADGAFLCPDVMGYPNTNATIWNPLPGFVSEAAKNQQQPGYFKQHIPPLDQFYKDVQKGTLPAVSWITPGPLASEHPGYGVQEGMQYVTGLINAIMESPYWNSTVIFLAWDDWGGFLDHEPPPIADYVNATGAGRIPMGYGIRVPGIIISPWVVPQIDHQVVSFDAYLRFIEDLFLGGARIGAAGTARPDSRKVHRESLVKVTSRSGGTIPVGDLMNDFDVNQTPIPPLVMPTRIPPEFAGRLDQAGVFHFPLTWHAVTTGPVLGYNVKRTTTSGAGYENVPGCSSAGTSYFTGTKCTDSTASKGTAYYYIITSIAPDGTESPNSAEVDITP